MNDPIKEYVALVNAYFGIYTDASHGFNLVRDYALKAEYEHRKSNADPSTSCIIGGFNPHPAPKLMRAKKTTKEMSDSLVHQANACDVIKRTEYPNGSDHIVMRRMTIAMIYSVWEDKYREKIARFLELPPPPVNCEGNKQPYKNSLSISAMADLWRFRHAIVHHNSIATSKTEEVEVFTYFKSGDPINFTHGRILQIKNFLNNNLKEECLYVRSESQKPSD